MGKSLAATLFALLVKDGTYTLGAAGAGAALADSRAIRARRSATSTCCA